MAELNNEKLKQALQMVMAEEFENVSDELSFTPSEQFEKKMEKLIKRAKKPYYKYTSTGVRRAICVIAAILVLMLSTLTVSAVRDTVGSFFERVFLSSQQNKPVNKVNKPQDNKKPTTTKNNSEDSTKNQQTIQTLYELGYIPDGFELASFDNTGYVAKTEYFKDEDKIVFTQFAKGSYVKTIDDETTFKDVEYIDNQKYRIYTSTYSSEITIVWNNGDYVFSVYSTLPKDEVLSLCESIQIQEPNNYQDTIKDVYKLDKLPEGFELVDYSIDENKVLYVYSFENKSLTFTQNVKFSYNSAQDGNAVKSIEIYDNQKYTIYTWDSGETNISWDNKEYVFDIQSNLSKEEIIALCQSITVAEQREYTEKIKTVYHLGALPVGFKLISFEKQENEVTTKYSSTTGNIKLKQYTNNKYSFSADIENAEKSLKVIDGKKYTIHIFDNSDDTVIIWEDEGYVFSVRSSLPEDKVISICKSIKVGEPRKDAPEKTTKRNNQETTTRNQTLEKIYELGFLPDGYSLIDYAPESSNVSYVYSCADKMLMFSQNMSSDYSSSVDKQSATETVETHNNQEYTIYTFENGDINIIWNDGEYIFDLFGNLDKQQALDMCKSIKIKGI